VPRLYRRYMDYRCLPLQGFLRENRSSWNVCNTSATRITQKHQRRRKFPGAVETIIMRRQRLPASVLAGFTEFSRENTTMATNHEKLPLRDADRHRLEEDHHLATDADGNEVFYGLTVEETAEYLVLLSQRRPLVARNRERRVLLQNKHERARLAGVALDPKKNPPG
jgi:hypothetical protein